MKTSEIEKLSDAQIAQRIEETRKEVYDAKSQISEDKVKSHEIIAKRREIAQLKTAQTLRNKNK